jgi:AraC-like DNA-binding protein
MVPVTRLGPAASAAAEPPQLITGVSAYLAEYKEPSRTREWPTPYKVRPRHRLRVILDGRATFVVGTARVAVEGGTVLAIPPHVPDTGVQDVERPLRYALLHAVVRTWSAWGTRGSGDGTPGGPALLPALIRPRPERWPEVQRLVDTIVRELGESRPGRSLVADGAMTQLFGVLWREAVETGALASPAAEPEPWAVDVMEHIARNYQRPVTLAELAEAASLSRAHFSTTFRRTMGQSPFTFLRRYRLQRAKELLHDERLSVAEVAAAVGIPDPYYFSRAFRRTEGLSPRQYRQARRRAPSEVTLFDRAAAEG